MGRGFDSMITPSPSVDVCIILEGTYPYVTGGVSEWTHNLINAQKDISFHIAAVLHRKMDLTMKYKLPENVKGITNIFIQDFQHGDSSFKHIKEILHQLEEPLLNLQTNGGLPEIHRIINIIKPYRQKLGIELLLNSLPAWEMLLRMYNKSYPETSFLDYFWTWRALLGGLYSILMAQMPMANVYHSISTGFAGLFASRAYLETGRPVLLTEHGIYTNERRIELEMADWLFETPLTVLSIDKPNKELRNLWINTFIGYSMACYEACSKIIALYEGNQQIQIEDGAAPERLEVIPNGVEFDHYAAIKREDISQPVIAFIGRVVPIKDLKTFIRSCAIILERMPDTKVFIIGPTDEGEDYFKECKEMLNYLGLEKGVTFTGRVKIEEYLHLIKVNVLTSISEAMPLTILEAGAAGIPTVATDVGACKEMILGSIREEPKLAPGGAITPLSSPTATAHAVLELLTNGEWYKRCSHAIQERVRLYYNKANIDMTYRNLYKKYISMADLGRNI
ncbi:MAG: GT4 family glycosyltransferase PelF [Nitrospinae bacterium]|nr:GT4 family glycosyltransferase PelF [Nitrospinota bacterium]